MVLKIQKQIWAEQIKQNIYQNIQHTRVKLISYFCLPFYFQQDSMKKITTLNV